VRVEEGDVRLEPREIPVPVPGEGELRLRVRAASLNRGEYIYAHGGARNQEARPSGGEAAGEVDALGPGVAGWKTGERVMARARGAFAEYAIADAREAMRAPESLSWAEAAAVPLVMLVTYDMLWEQGRLRPGEWLLVTGVSSGVGVASLQVGSMLGARVIGTSGSPAKLERLAALGLEVALPTRSPDFAEAVLRATGGKGVNLAVNNVGGTLFAECVKCLAYQGRLATVGYLDRTFHADIDIDALHSKRLRLFGVSNRFRGAPERARTVAGFVRHVLPAIEDGRIRPLIDRIFSFDQMPAAKAYMDTDSHAGKIVVTM
jgi:NADPH:quinone reductase-like Zn-dependent oxidoreductase